MGDNVSTASSLDLESSDLEVVEIKKSFGSVPVLKGVNFTVHSGEFVGFMGPNGAGKSTLIKILAGVYSSSSGQIRLGGKVVNSLAGHSDVGFIHQDLGLVDGMTVAENLSLGASPKRRFGPILNKKAEKNQALRILSRMDLDIHPDTLLSELTPGKKTLVAVARLFDRGAKILVVDETTSTLPPADAKNVMEALAAAAERGAAIIMVTHKLSEILAFTNRVLVIIDGELMSDTPTKGLDRRALVEKLRQSVTDVDELPPMDRPSPECLIEVKGACVGDIGPIDLKINSGEIVGVSGLPGSGLYDVAFLVSGHVHADRGHVELLRPKLKRAVVPPDREKHGGFSALTVRENMAIASLRKWRRRSLVIDQRRERQDCEEILSGLAIKPNSPDVEFDVLSGGNKQKVIFGRALLYHPDVYVLCEPTRGVDVGTRSEIYRLIREIASQGAGVLVVSSDAEDLFSVCDRVGLMAKGRLQPLQDIADLSPSDLEMMV